jgi:hypothetical protein
MKARVMCAGLSLALDCVARKFDSARGVS